jgi:serine/threonine protein kinase
VDSLRGGDPSQVGRYRLIGRLGGGGMGQVFLGETPGGRKVAVKVIRPEYADDPDFRLRFAREIEAVRRVGGFHTAQVVDTDPAADPPFMVTSYIPGPALNVVVAEEGPLEPASLRELGAALAEGLAAIHESGLIHRDLKPSNIILAADGPRIIDFGIAKDVGAATITATGIAIGTLRYMSPEHLSTGEIGPASDVFSLGAVLTFAATGRGPFDASVETAVLGRILTQPPDLGNLTGSLRDVITACLDKDPGARPNLAELLAYFTGTGGPAAPVREAMREPTVAAVLETPPPPRQPFRSVAQAERDPAAGGTRSLTGLSLLAPASPALEHSGTIDLISFSPDTRFLVGAADDLTIRIWDTSTWRSVGEPISVDLPLAEHRRAFRQVIFTRSGSLLATISKEPALWHWQITQKGRDDEPPSLRVPTGQRQLGLSPDGSGLVTVHQKKLLLTDTATGRHKVLDSKFTAPGDSGHLSIFSPDGRLLCSLSDVSQIQLWRTDTGQRVGLLRRPLLSGYSRWLAIQQMAVSSDKRFVIARTQADNAQISLYGWDRRAQNYSWPELIAENIGEESDFTFSPDGRFLAFIHHRRGSADSGVLRLWDGTTRKILDLQACPQEAWGLAFSPNGRLLAAASRRELRLWDAATRQPISIEHRRTSDDNIIRDIAFSPDSRMLAIAEDQSVRAWKTPQLSRNM